MSQSHLSAALRLSLAETETLSKADEVESKDAFSDLSLDVDDVEQRRAVDTSSSAL